MSSTHPTPSVEGEIDFPVPSAGKPCKTWYKLFGTLPAVPGVTPLVALHGGPGCTHEYLLVLSGLTTSLGVPLIVYDQIGNGHSTHLREKDGDLEFWTETLFLDELANLLSKLGVSDNYAVLGHSWGGMLAARHATLQPLGLKALIIADSPADMGLWVEAQNRLRLLLPEEVQVTLTRCEEEGLTDGKEYKDAVDVFYSRFLCRLDPMPEPVLKTMEAIDKDPTVYLTMNGPSEFYITGPLKNWSIISSLHKISVPTLLINGRYDEAQDSCVLPFFRGISRVKWVQFAESAHMPHQEEPGWFLQVVGDFLMNF